MRLSCIVALASLICFGRELSATSCTVVPPCARVSSQSILFVGTALDDGVLSSPVEVATRDFRIQVDEPLAGLLPNEKVIVVTVAGSWLEKGRRYLIDAYMGQDKHFQLRDCGSSGEITERSTSEVLDYLRQRLHGKTKTTLIVRVTDQYTPVPDANVTVSNSDGSLVGRTGADGVVTFDEVKPAVYRVAATRAHYHADKDENPERQLNILPGTCASASVALRAEGVVTGLVRDFKGGPVTSLELELISVPSPRNGSNGGTLEGPFFEATTDSDGKFLFESVSPGAYLLGSNIIGLNTSRVPSTYYPGLRSKDSALPIEVRPGESVDHLLFALPDFGATREIQVCVLDEAGKPVPGADVGTDVGSAKSDSAGLAGNRLTDKTGCVQAGGYARIQYAIHATLSPLTGDFRQTRFSQWLVVPPAEEPVHLVLKLNNSIGYPRLIP